MHRIPSHLDLGGCTVEWLDGGINKLDAGAMFGAVPKVLWNRQSLADDTNCMEMCNNPLLITTTEKRVIIDTGLGNKLTEKQEKIFRVGHPWAVIDDLRERGIDRLDIDYVLLTHGDFDHAGGAVYNNEKGELEATFPRATYIIQQKEWDDICNPIDRTKHTYFSKNFDLLKTNGQLLCVNGEAEVIPGLKVYHSGGHTRGHQIVEISGERGRAVHLGDLLPTHHHINPLWIMAYDNFPLEVIERKKEFFSKYQREEYWFTLYHDVQMRALQINEDNEIVNSL